MFFEILGELSDVETIAVGSSIREMPRLRKRYGTGRWRERKGIGRVRLPDGSTRPAELHWYEALSVGRFEYKIKRYVES